MAVAPVDAPESKPGDLGLLSVAEEVNLNERWDDGIAFVPATCVLPEPLPLYCIPEVDEAVYDALTENEAAIAWRPFVTLGRDNCAFLFPDADEREARLREHLEATESYQAEREFMFMAATGDAPNPNPGLLGGDGFISVPSGSTYAATVAAVDAAIYEALGGQEGMLHLSPAVGAAVAKDFKWDNDAEVYRTALGNRVVVGSGYARGTFGGTTVVNNAVFGTPMVFFTRGEITYQGFDPSQANTARNLRNLWAERPVLLWSSLCAVVGALAVPNVGGGGGGGDGVDGGDIG